MASHEDGDLIEISADDLPQEPSPARIVIESDDLPADQEPTAAQVARLSSDGRVYPGLKGQALPELYAVGRCSAQKGQYVLALIPRPEGGYQFQPLSGPAPVDSAQVGSVQQLRGPFVMADGKGCPLCGNTTALVCERCGTVFCHPGGKQAECPACHMKGVQHGLATRLSARGGKGRR